MKTGGRLRAICVGGLAFWLPAIVVSAIFREGASVLMLNVASLSGLLVLGISDWMRSKSGLKWNWALAGIYILGPAAIVAASSFSGGHLEARWDWGFLLIVLLCLFPPTTLWFSLLNGMIFALLIASLVLPLLAIVGPRVRNRLEITNHA